MFKILSAILAGTVSMITLVLAIVFIIRAIPINDVNTAILLILGSLYASIIFKNINEKERDNG